MRNRIKIVLFFILLLNIRLAVPGLFGSIDREQESGSKYWWQIEIGISVTGEYEYRKNNDTAKGDYSFDTVLTASMERDNGDYLLYKGSKKTHSITWKETLSPGTGPVKKNDLSKKIFPEFELNYVMRREGKIHFDCTFASIPLPLEGKKPAARIILPRSAENENINPKAGYNAGLTKGSNKIVVNEMRIYREKEISEIFSWTWQGEKSIRSPLSSIHNVELKLKIRRVNK